MKNEKTETDFQTIRELLSAEAFNCSNDRIYSAWLLKISYLQFIFMLWKVHSEHNVTHLMYVMYDLMYYIVWEDMKKREL